MIAVAPSSKCCVSTTEIMIGAIAEMLAGLSHIAVGASSPIPGSAALLTRARSGGRTRVSVLGSRENNPFTDGGRELFDCAGQGRIDAFFLSGGQIDGKANINLVGVGDLGDYPRAQARFPGSFGSSYLYFVVPRVILFREEHTPRTLVDKVDFISAPGTSPPEVYRPGGPYALVTSAVRLRLRPRARAFHARKHASGRHGEGRPRSHRVRLRRARRGAANAGARCGEPHAPALRRWRAKSPKRIRVSHSKHWGA